VAKTVAVVGASADPRKFGNKAVRAFAAQGYEVFPIHPSAASVEGLRAYASVLDVPGPLDMATVYVPPEVGVTLLEDFARKGIPEIWFNPGAEDDALLDAARARGLNVVAACSIIGIGEQPGRF
jgi:predicted CoA-binding protein